MNLTINERIAIAEKYIETINKMFSDSGRRELDLRIWSKGKHVRIYGLKKFDYVAILENGKIENEVNNPYPEIHAAIRALSNN